MPDETAGAAPTATRRTSFRVFVSSTFQDFHHERDSLRRVESALRERLRPSGVGLTLVDLRWGVFSEGSEGERELDILGVCLDEVERTRPLFLGLLGDRYGWVPDPELATAVAADRGFPGAVAGRSVTELEIEHGVLGHPEILEHAVFLLREFDPGPPPGMAEPPGSQAQAALDHLRERLMASGARTVAYTVDADRHAEDLEAFETLAIEELWRLLEPQLATEDDPAESIQAGFRRDRAAGHVDDGTLERIAERVRTGSGTATVLVGDVGSGKSAALASLADLFEARGVRTMFHAFGLGPASTRHELVHRLVVYSGADDTGATENDRIRNALRALDDGTSFVLCIDALDAGTDDTDQVLSWLPDPLPRWLHVVASTGGWPAYATRAVSLEVMAPLDLARAVEIIRRRFAERAKQIPQPALEALVTKPNGNVRASESPLWITVAADLLAGLDVSDFARLDGLPGDAQERVVALVTSTADALPGDLVGLYAAAIDRARRADDPAVTDAVLRAVALSPAGLPSRELTAVASDLIDRPITDRDLARVRWSMRGQLIELGTSGEIDIAHVPLYDAVADPMDDDDRRTTRSTMATTLLRLRDESPFADDTALHLFFAAGDVEGVRAWMAGTDDDTALVVALVDHWTHPDADADHQVVVGAVVDGPDGELGARCLLIASSELASRGVAPDRRLEVITAVEAGIRRRSEAEPESVPWLHLLGLAMMRRRNLVADDDPPAAASLADRIVRLYRRLIRIDDAAIWSVNLAESLIEQARLAADQEGSEAAVALAHDAVAAARRAVELDDHPSHRRVLGDIGLLASRMLDRAGERIDAEVTARQALADLEALHHDDPADRDVLYDLSRARSHAAGILVRNGDALGAEHLVELAVDGAERLLAASPSDLGALRVAANIRRQAATVSADLGRVGDEEVHLDFAERHLRTEARIDPHSIPAIASLAETLRRRAESQRGRALIEDARSRFDQCIDVATRLTEIDHRTPARWELLASILLSAADLELGSGQLGRAEELTQQALVAVSTLAAIDSEQSQAHWLTAGASSRAGQVAQARGDLRSAWRHHEEAVAARERAVAVDSGDTSALLALAASLRDLAEIAFQADDLGAATRLLERALPLGRGLEDLDPDDPKIAAGMARTLVAIAFVVHAEGDTAAAVDLLRGAQARWEHIATIDPAALDPYVRLGGVHLQIGLVHADAGQRDAAVAELLTARRLYLAVDGVQSNDVTDRGVAEVDQHLRSLGWSESG